MWAYIIFEVVVETVLVSAKTFLDLGKQPLNKIPNAFYEYYEGNYGVTIYQAIEHLRSVAAEEHEARLLGVDIDGPGKVDPKTKVTVYSYAHPLFWAPFTLIGDGGGARDGCLRAGPAGNK